MVISIYLCRLVLTFIHIFEILYLMIYLTDVLSFCCICSPRFIRNLPVKLCLITTLRQ